MLVLFLSSPFPFSSLLSLAILPVPVCFYVCHILPYVVLLCIFCLCFFSCFLIVALLLVLLVLLFLLVLIVVLMFQNQKSQYPQKDLCGSGVYFQENSNDSGVIYFGGARSV